MRIIRSFVFQFKTKDQKTQFLKFRFQNQNEKTDLVCFLMNKLVLTIVCVKVV